MIQDSLYQLYKEKANALIIKKNFKPALELYNKIIQLYPHSVVDLRFVALLFFRLKRYREAYFTLLKIWDLGPHDMSLSDRIFLFKIKKDFLFWDGLNEDIAYFQKDEILKSGQLEPFFANGYIPLTNEQRQKVAIAFVQKSKTFGINRFKYTFQDRVKNPPKIKLGFLSADFRHHPTGYVISEFFELIDRDKFDLYLYDTLPTPKAKASQRIYTTTPNIRVVDKKTNEEIADTIFADRIDILIDLTGLTTHTRTGVMTYHPGFVQGTFLGSIGTCGNVPGIDYHFVDRYSILPGEEKYYCEKLNYLEPTRWVIDHKMAKPAEIHSKSFYGFKEDSIVLCCFNNAYKFTSHYFDIWARILKAVPQANLWFYSNSIVLNKNLISEFSERGISSNQIVISDFLSDHCEHLSRYLVADLFLDTEFYNAHTTAMESLFMGCPLITCPGKEYTNRVGGALLTALELPELICKNIHEYEDKIIQLCQNPDQLKKLRQKVLEKGKTSPLFDMKKFTKSFEKACQDMYSDAINHL